jgi:Domain of unknown function (DUF4145)
VASKRSETLNKTQGKEIDVACSKCAGRTTHQVILSLDQYGEDTSYDISWWHHYQIVRCGGCKTVSFREMSSNSEEVYQVSEDEWEHAEHERLYPPRVEGRKDLGDDVAYLPVEIQRIYSETIQALSGDSPVLAGMGLRALVETVCKERKAKGRDLQKKIDDLETQRVLTPGGAKILHKIRTLGNAAAHEVKPHTVKQLALAMEIVEHLLRDVYIPRLGRKGVQIMDSLMRRLALAQRLARPQLSAP